MSHCLHFGDAMCAHLPSVCTFAHLYSSYLFSCLCSFNSTPISTPTPRSEDTENFEDIKDDLFFKGKRLSSVSLLLPLSFSYTCRHLRRYVYVLDKLYFPHSHCSTLQHCFSTLSDNGEELLSLTCSHILRSYASRLLTSAAHLLHAACCVPLIVACFNGMCN